jgi:hypothetical protein
MITIILLLTLAAQEPAARPVAFGPGVALLIDEMDGDLDGFLRAEIMKKKVPVNLVIDKEAADFIATGSASERKGSWHEGLLTTEKDKATGAVSIVSKTGQIVWAEEAGDRSLMWGSAFSRGGPRKVASRLADRLKDYMKNQK